MSLTSFNRIDCSLCSTFIRTLASSFNLSPRNHLSIQSQHFSSFRYRDLLIQKSAISKPKPDASSLVFGREFTDHMFKVEWSPDGWSTPEITPLQNFNLHPSAKVLHYANTLFEGFKAYRGVDDKVRIIRPDMNLKRMLRSAERSAFPSFEAQELLNCIKKLIAIDADWVLPAHTNCSVYVRPTMIATQASLGVNTSNCGILFVILSPVGSYFTSGSEIKPVNLFADPNIVRAWPGGTGDSKLGSNYGPTIAPQNSADRKGFQQLLWLFGPDHNLTEAGTMNIFVALKNKNNSSTDLITPPLADGLILPGVNRDSIIKLTSQWPEINLIERNITMKEVQDAASDGSLLEMFGAGTACVVSPIGGINFKGQQINIPTPVDGIAQRIYKLLTDIFYARIQHEWNRDVIC